MTTILGRVQENVDFYVAWVESTNSKEEADEATAELMRMEALQIEEKARPGRILRRSSFADGSETVVNTKPDLPLVEARLKIITAGLRKVKAIYKAKGWEF